MLNRVLRWEPSGVIYEPDQRHAEVIIRELGLENAGSVFTPRTRVEQDVASSPSGALGIAFEQVSEPMGPQDATPFRSLAARYKYLGQDRVDLQCACKEVSRRMRDHAATTGSCSNGSRGTLSEPRGFRKSSGGRAYRPTSTFLRIQTGRDAKPEAEAPAAVPCCGASTA